MLASGFSSSCSYWRSRPHDREPLVVLAACPRRRACRAQLRPRGPRLELEAVLANSFAASSCVIGFFERTISRSPDHVALPISRSLNASRRSRRSPVSASGLSAEKRVVRMIIPLTVVVLAGLVLARIRDVRDLDAGLARLLERLADLARIDLDVVPGLVAERDDDLGATLEVDRPVHVLAAHRLVEEQDADRDGHQQDREDEPGLELRDERRSCCRAAAGSGTCGCSLMAPLRWRSWPSRPSSWRRTSRRRSE